MQTTPPTGWDQLHRCVGCGALLTGPCLPGCALVTGAVTACLILRAAVSQLALHTAGGGCRIDFAIPSTALDLADEPRAEDLTAIALAALTDHLIRSGNASGSRDQVVYRYGLATRLGRSRPCPQRHRRPARRHRNRLRTRLSPDLTSRGPAGPPPTGRTT